MAKRKVIVKDKNDLAWILAGKNRVIVLKAMKGALLTPKLLGQKIGMGAGEASRVLRAMAARGIVECPVPERKKGRLYELTRKGRNLERLL